MSEELQKAFETQGLAGTENTAPSYKHLVYESEAELKALEALLTDLRKTKLGAELIADAEKYGTQIGFVSGMRAYGSFDEVTKRVKLNPNNGHDCLVGTLAHELRHSQQFMNGVVLDAYLDTPKSYVQNQGIIEADASTAACEVVYDLAVYENKVGPLEKLREKDPHIVNPFQNAMVRGDGVSGGAHKAAFFGWFTNYSTRDCYDINYIKMYQQRRRNASRAEDDIKLEREVPRTQTAEQACRFDGKPYLSGKEVEEFFKTDDACSISFERFNNVYSELYFKYNLDYKRGTEAVMKEDFGLTVRPHSSYMPRPVVPEPLPLPEVSFAKRQAEAQRQIGKFHQKSRVSLNKLLSEETNKIPAVPVKKNLSPHDGTKWKVNVKDFKQRD